MLFSLTVPVVTTRGRKFPGAIVDAYGDRCGVAVHIFTSRSRRVALRVNALMQVHVRSADCDSDPVAGVDYELKSEVVYGGVEAGD
jgi:hypothetical protein